MIEFASFLTPFLALFSSLLIIFTIRTFDFVEFEPLHVIRTSLFAGVILLIPILQLYAYADLFWSNFNFSENILDKISTIIDAPVIEEFCKALALILIFRFHRKEFDTLTDYIVYSFCVAIGFELVENILYLWSSLASEVNPIDHWFNQVSTRVVHSGGVHGLFSIWIGVGLWLFAEKKSKGRIVLAPLCFLISIMLHLINNLSASYDSYYASIIYNANHQLMIALFIGILLYAISLDVSYLNSFTSHIRRTIIESSSEIDNSIFSKLEYFGDSTNHLRANLSKFNLSVNKYRVSDLSHYIKLAFSYKKTIHGVKFGSYNADDVNSLLNTGIQLLDNAQVKEDVIK